MCAQKKIVHFLSRRLTNLRFMLLSIVIDKRVVTEQSTACYDNEKSETLPMGWALQKRAPSRKFPEAVKKYLTARFDLGEATGRKADPTQVSVDMRIARD